MPFATTVSVPSCLGLARVYGASTGLELLGANTALYSDARWVAGFDELWDCRRIQSFVVDIGEMNAVADMETEGPDIVGDGRVAIVATRDVVRMMGGLYAAMMQDSGRNIRLFRSMEEAAKWLGLPSVPAWFETGSEGGTVTSTQAAKG